MENNIGKGCTSCWSKNWVLRLVFGLVIFFSGLGVQRDSKAHSEGLDPKKLTSLHLLTGKEQGVAPSLCVAMAAGSSSRSFSRTALPATILESKSMGRERRGRGFHFGGSGHGRWRLASAAAAAIAATTRSSWGARWWRAEEGVLVGEGKGGYEDAHHRSNRAVMASRRRSTRVLCFWGRNRGARNWSEEEDGRRAAQLGELGGGVESSSGHVL